VANTLKRFMRTLDEPILLEQLRSDWMEASMMEDQSEKLIRSDIIFCAMSIVNKMWIVVFKKVNFTCVSSPWWLYEDQEP
jgi:hypothetical protein